MDHVFANAGFLLSIGVIIYGLWRQRQSAPPMTKPKPGPKQSFEDWANESRRKVYEARRRKP